MSTLIFLVLYVDDVLLIGNNILLMEVVKVSLRDCFSMKDFREASYIIGTKIYRDRSKRLIELSQSIYIDKVLNRFNMNESKKGFIPMSHGITLSKTQLASSPDKKERMSRLPYVSAGLYHV